MESPICSIKLLPQDQWIEAGSTAARINPANAPTRGTLGLAAPDVVIEPEHLALLTAKYWGSGGVRLTVGFLDSPAADLRARILSHMNAWGAFCNVQFTETASNPQVRIARTAGSGYWSYLGTDVLHISPGQPTMKGSTDLRTTFAVAGLAKAPSGVIGLPNRVFSVEACLPSMVWIESAAASADSLLMFPAWPR